MMKRLFGVSLVLFCLVMWWCYPALLSLLGQNLVADDFDGQADVGIVLAGEFPNRLMEGAKLLLERRIGVLLITLQEPSRGIEVLKSFDIEQFSEQRTKQRLLEAMGVPLKRVEFLPTFAESTSHEARLVRSWLKDRQSWLPNPKVVVVSSATHTKRARWIFRHELAELATVTAKPSRYDAFDSRNWWTSRKFLREVVFEYEKMVGRFVLD